MATEKETERETERQRGRAQDVAIKEARWMNVGDRDRDIDRKKERQSTRHGY